MDDTFKKMIYSGIGFVSIAAKNLEQAIKDMQEKGNLSDEEGQRIINDFKEEAGKSRVDLEKEFKDAVQNMLNKMDIARKQDLQVLEKRIEALEEKSTLEKRLSALENKQDDTES